MGPGCVAIVSLKSYIIHLIVSSLLFHDWTQLFDSGEEIFIRVFDRALSTVEINHDSNACTGFTFVQCPPDLTWLVDAFSAHPPLLLSFGSDDTIVSRQRYAGSCHFYSTTTENGVLVLGLTSRNYADTGLLALEGVLFRVSDIFDINFNHDTCLEIPIVSLPGFQTSVALHINITKHNRERPMQITYMMHIFAITSLLLLLCIPARTFAPLPRRRMRRSSTILFAAAEQSNDDDSRMTIPNDFKMFLTQCSIQSFMFLVRSMRDPQTVMWIEEFTQPAIVEKQTGYVNVTVLVDSRQIDEQHNDEEEGEKEDEEDGSVTEAFIDEKEGEKDSDADLGELLRELLSVFVPGRKNESVTESSISKEEDENDNDEEDETVTKAPITGDVDTDEDDECPAEPEEPRKFSKLLQYHGLAALNTTIFPTWDVYFQKLLQEPTKIYIVESDLAHVPEYELEIDPSSLCSRIISVRQQISIEFVKDLQVIANMGGSVLQSYWDNLKATAENNETDVPLFQRENLLFLELSPDERSDHGPSPLRKGNFDLLTLLTLQEGIFRVLNDESRQDGPERVTNEYLKQFYLERAHYFSGPQKYGRADDFLEELLSSSPRMITVAEGVTSLIDPTRITELVLKARKEVALEWKEISAESPKEHMKIQRMRLNRMMGVTDVEGAEEPFQ